MKVFPKLVGIVSIFSLIASAQNEQIIFRDNTHFREGPGNYYPLIALLQKGLRISLVQEQSGWTQVRCNDQDGWISTNALQEVEEGHGIERLLSSPLEEKPRIISKASASGAVRGFAQKYVRYHAGSEEFIDQYDAYFFQPREYHKFRDETYRARDVNKIRRRYQRIKIENDNPEITGQMEKMGLAVAAQIAAEGLQSNFSRLRYINMVGNLVVESSPLYDYPVKFYILDDERPTAYAAPNGMIFVSAGLLDVIQDEAELACVLAHELSHVIQQHGYQEILKRETQVIAEGAFEELDAEIPEEDETAEELDQLALQMFEAATSKRQIEYEYEADWLGAIYAYRAGYDPMGLCRVLKKIEQLTDRDFWHPESNWQYDAIEDRASIMAEKIQKKLDKHPEWNVSNTRRYQMGVR